MAFGHCDFRWSKISLGAHKNSDTLGRLRALGKDCLDWPRIWLERSDEVQVGFVQLLGKGFW
jgi:hypothetical protein